MKANHIKKSRKTRPIEEKYRLVCNADHSDCKVVEILKP